MLEWGIDLFFLYVDIHIKKQLNYLYILIIYCSLIIFEMLAYFLIFKQTSLFVLCLYLNLKCLFSIKQELCNFILFNKQWVFNTTMISHWLHIIM